MRSMCWTVRALPICLAIFLISVLKMMTANAEKLNLMQTCALCSQMNCSNPQPRAVFTSNFFKERYVLVEPHMILVNRCDENSGCCKEFDHVCTMKKSDTVEMDVLYRNYDGDEIKPKTIKVLQHKQCSCEQKTKKTDIK